MNFRNPKSASGYATKQPQWKWQLSHFSLLNGGIWENPVNDCKSENGINSGWSGHVLISTEYSSGLLWWDLQCSSPYNVPLRNQLLAMHTFLCLFPPSYLCVCSRCSLCSYFLCLPYKENSPSWDPNHVNNIKDVLLNPANKPSDSVSSLSAPPPTPSPPPPLLLRLLLFHCLNMTGAPRSLSKVGDRWNWWALQVQHETSGQAWVIGATNSVVRAAVGATLLIQLTSLTLGFKLRLWVYHQMLDLMIKILSLVVELSDVKRTKLTGCLSPLWTKHNTHWGTGWKSMDVERPSGLASKAV